MGRGQVHAVVAQGNQYLAEIIRQVTGNPAGLRAKSQECSRCASETGAAAGAIEKIVTELLRTWLGQAAESCRRVNSDLVKRLVDTLKRELEEESQRLADAARAIEDARKKTEQTKQDFGQRTDQIIKIMDALIKAALSMADPGTRAALIAKAISQALSAATKARNAAQQTADSTAKSLTETLVSLFSKAVTSVAA